MNKLWFVMVLFAAACSKDAPTTGGNGSAKAVMTAKGSGAAVAVDAGTPMTMTGSGSGSGSAAPEPLVIKPYTPAADVPAPIKAAIAATDRTDADRALDAGRKPGEVLAFFKIAPGQNVGELFAAGGYTSELMGRVVGDKGKVYAENTTMILDKFARKPLTARLAKPVNKNIVMVERAAEDPFPPEAKNLDAVVCILNYHDFVWMKVDRDKMNKAVFDALKPGGYYEIVDSAAAPKSGLRDVETLHRIDPESVKAEVEKAGFKLDASSDVLANKDDKHDWSSSPKAAGDKRGTSDRFTLRFIKPKK
jgi:predicted methyltransferase|nr:SAM-dependent methyltransferase [Kofleriaceae bacterium]